MQIGRETAEKSCLEKKIIEKQIAEKHYIPEILKTAFLQKRWYNDNTDVNLFQYFTRAEGSSEMRLKKDWRRYCIYRYDVIIAMATLYRYDVIFCISLS